MTLHGGDSFELVLLSFFLYLWVSLLESDGFRVWHRIRHVPIYDPWGFVHDGWALRIELYRHLHCAGDFGPANCDGSGFL